MYWRSATCFSPFCGSPNNAAFVKTFFIIYLSFLILARTGHSLLYEISTYIWIPQHTCMGSQWLRIRKYVVPSILVLIIYNYTERGTANEQAQFIGVTVRVKPTSTTELYERKTFVKNKNKKNLDFATFQFGIPCRGTCHVRYRPPKNRVPLLCASYILGTCHSNSTPTYTSFFWVMNHLSKGFRV